MELADAGRLRRQGHHLPTGMGATAPGIVLLQAAVDDGKREAGLALHLSTLSAGRNKGALFILTLFTEKYFA